MNHDISFIVEKLRETPLAWLAEEIETAIGAGKMVIKEYREPGSRRTKKATTVVEFTNEEQEEIAIKTLANYLLVLPKLWSHATDAIAKNVNTEAAAPVTITLQDASGREFQPFEDTFYQTTEKLKLLLQEAWPKGPADFHSKTAMNDFVW